MERRIGRGLAVAALVWCAAGCASPPAPPAIDARVADFVAADPGWRAWLEAALAAQDAYHFIQDTPAADLAARRETVGERVRRARDACRRAQTYRLANLKLETGCEETYDAAEALGRRQLAGAVTVNGGLAVVYGFDGTGGVPDCRTADGSLRSINSSRGRRIVVPGRGFIGEFHHLVRPEPADLANLIVQLKAMTDAPQTGAATAPGGLTDAQ